MQNNVFPQCSQASDQNVFQLLGQFERFPSTFVLLALALSSALLEIPDVIATVCACMLSISPADPGWPVEL